MLGRPHRFDLLHAAVVDQVLGHPGRSRYHPTVGLRGRYGYDSRVWKPLTIAIALLALVVSACAAGETTATTTPATPTISATTSTIASTTALAPAAADLVETWGDSTDVVGATVLVVRGDGSTETIEYGFADREAGVRTDADSQYRIGSITKVYTAATVMSLAEDGLLALDDPAADYVPSLPPEITIEHLLGHTSGLRDVDVTAGIIEVALGGGETGDPVDSPLEVVDRGLVFEPGTRQEYSSVGYLALERVIEAAAGTTYEEALTEHLPLAGTSTELEDGESELPTAYERLSPAIPAFSLADLETTAFARNAGGAGALVATAADVAGFIRALFDGAVVSEASLEWMMDASPPRVEYGLGLSVYPVAGTTVYGHNGRTIGFATSVRHDPATNTTVVVLANDGGAETSEFADQLIAAELARAAS